MTTRTIEGPEGRLHMEYDGEGFGVPVLFVHSDGGALGQWDEVRLGLQGQRPTAAFDRRGHGRSDPPRSGSFAHEAASADIAAVARAIGWPRFVLVGHSGGALNAFTFAALNSSRVAGLVLVDPPPDPAAMPPGWAEDASKALESPDGVAVAEQHYRSIAGPDPQVVTRVLADLRQTPKATLAGTTRAYADFHPASLAPRITTRALSVIQPQYDVEGALHRLPPGFESLCVDNAGHWIHLGAAEQFSDILDAFLEEIDEQEIGRRSLAEPEAHPS